MNGKDITGVNKIVTNDLDVNNQIDMKSKKIIGVGNGTANSDAVNKAQLDSVETQVKSQITTVNNQVTQNKTDIATIDTNNGYYYYTNNLQHDNSHIIAFPNITNSYPYSKGVSNNLRINLSGTYHIIYTDFYKGTGIFRIRNLKNGKDVFTMSLDDQTKWAPITINTIFSVDVGGSYCELKIYASISDNSAIFDGNGYSTFYIK